MKRGERADGDEGVHGGGAVAEVLPGRAVERKGRPQNDEPPPVLNVPGDQQWEVDKILDAKIWWGSLWYMCSF